jgi:ABC-type cobalamin/Fe3+-siderophores transport system ATPase subunit
MNDIFITNIHVKQSRNISNFDIPLSQEKRSHLILTGKNGSGKTSLLMDLHELLNLALRIDHESRNGQPKRLRKLFQSPELELEFDRKNYNFY